MAGSNTTIKTYEFKIRPNKKFVESCERTLDGCRHLYNAALEQRISHYQYSGKGISAIEQSRQLTELRQEDPVQSAIYRDIQTDALKRLDLAYSAFFRRVKSGETPGFPRFKGRNRYDSFGCQRRERNPFPIKGDKLTFPGVGACRIRLSRTTEEMGQCCHVRMIRRIDGWYVQLVCKITKPEPLMKTGVDVGLDLGIESFATMSNGEQVENPRFTERARRKLIYSQRQLSRKTKGSNRRNLAKRKVALSHLKTSRCRKRFHADLANDLVRRFDLIAIEDLNIKGLAAGMLAKQVNDVAWSQFTMILTNKAEETGRQVVKVDPRYTSQDCSGCGSRKAKRLSIRDHVCLDCGLILHRDHNAAINILVRARGPEFKPVENDGILRSGNDAIVAGRPKRCPGGTKRRTGNSARL